MKTGWPSNNNMMAPTHDNNNAQFLPRNTSQSPDLPEIVFNNNSNIQSSVGAATAAAAAAAAATTPNAAGDGSSKSQCSSMSDGEHYEGYGESADLEIDPITNNGHSDGVNQPIHRNTWLRTSLRRSPPSRKDNLTSRRWGSFRTSSKRQLGSNALASQLYRSSSFNSSGRSSQCDTGDDMYSDVSLEEDVSFLNHTVQILQQKVNDLADSSVNDDRYTHVKAENAVLQARILMLEEQLRDVEQRAEERIQDEQRRHRELLVRVEREKQLQIENCNIRLQSIELETSSLRDEVSRQRAIIERLRQERKETNERILEAENNLVEARALTQSLRDSEKRLLSERDNNNHLLEELTHELERLRNESRLPALPTTSPEILRLEELHSELNALRNDNRQLSEANEELQAQMLTRGIEAGRSLLQTDTGNDSLAAEFQAMSQDQIQKALKEQQDVNIQLRAYIENILLNIVENSPQLLEVKRPSLRSETSSS